MLEQLYERISVPEAVITELRSSDAPLPVRQWSATLPAWVEVRAVDEAFLADSRWQPLHAGEQAALTLAILLKPTWFSWTNERELAWRARMGFV